MTPPRPPAPPRIRILPGFRLTLGFTLFYLGLIVLIPLAAAFNLTSQQVDAAFTEAAVL